MSEFGQQYRVFGLDAAQFRSFLDGIDGWSVGDVNADEQTLPAFFRTDRSPGLSDTIRFIANEQQNYTTLDMWNLDVHDMIVEALNQQNHTYLTYLFHTGAGSDELHEYQAGEIALVEDVGELNEFWVEGAVAELGRDFDRRDGTGRQFLIVTPPIRKAALSRLTADLGASASILAGWESCVKDSIPLSYAYAL